MDTGQQLTSCTAQGSVSSQREGVGTVTTEQGVSREALPLLARAAMAAPSSGCPWGQCIKPLSSGVRCLCAVNSF